MSIEDFDKEHERLLVLALASFLKISPSAVKVQSVSEGSVKVVLEVPEDASIELVAAYERRDDELFRYLRGLQDLGMTSEQTVLDAEVITIEEYRSERISLSEERDAGLTPGRPSHREGLEITQVKISPVEEETLKALVSLVFNHQFMVNDIRLIQGKHGLFVSMPSRRRRSGEFRDVAHPLNNQTRRLIEERIVEEYRCSFDDSYPDRPESRTTSSGVRSEETTETDSSLRDGEGFDHRVS